VTRLRHVRAIVTTNFHTKNAASRPRRLYNVQRARLPSVQTRIRSPNLTDTTTFPTRSSRVFVCLRDMRCSNDVSIPKARRRRQNTDNSRKLRLGRKQDSNVFVEMTWKKKNSLKMPTTRIRTTNISYMIIAYHTVSYVSVRYVEFISTATVRMNDGPRSVKTVCKNGFRIDLTIVPLRVVGSRFTCLCSRASRWWQTGLLFPGVDRLWTCRT